MAYFIGFLFGGFFGFLTASLLHINKREDDRDEN